jgi:hypothetical protein
LFARLVLPLLGGSPAVWNTCLMYFEGEGPPDRELYALRNRRFSPTAACQPVERPARTRQCLASANR